MKKLFLLIGTTLLCCAVFAQGYKNSVRTTFLSWGTGSVKLFYERQTGQNHTDEWGIGYIGCMHDRFDNDPRGFLLRYGHKFLVGLRNAERPMQGLFLEPQLFYNNFRYTVENSDVRARSEMMSVMATVGYQYIWKRFVVEPFFGIGFAMGEAADTWYEHGFMLLDMMGMKCEGISLASGIKVGVCF